MISQFSANTIKDIKGANSIDDNPRVDLFCERNAQISCVMRVMAESVERTKAALILPQVLRSDEDLNVLKGTQYAAVVPMINDYRRRRDIIIREKRSPLMDHGMIRIMDFFLRNNQLYKLFPNHMHHLSPKERKILFMLNKLCTISEGHLIQNSKSYIANEYMLHNIYQKLENEKCKIQKLKRMIDTQKIRLRWRMAAKSVCLNKCEERIDQEDAANLARLKNERDIRLNIVEENKKVAQEKQVLLEAEHKKLVLEHETQSDRILKLEVDAQTEKSKLEIQLQNIIKKYDQTICKKTIEKMDLYEKIYNENKLLEELMVKFEHQAEIYEHIVTDYEYAQKRRQATVITLFMLNRAARKIQRFWRKWRNAMKKKEAKKSLKSKRNKRKY